MSSLISVIVPVYNVEKYLEKCIDSILNQTYKNLEIILVDDGSKDQSGVICDSYAKKDKRIIVFHKKNGGLSSARNYGIDNSHGQYIGFVDSDDYISNDMYETLYQLITDYNADLAMCGLCDIYNGRQKNTKNKEYVYSQSRIDAIRNVMEGEVNSVSAVNKLYRKELFKEVRYPIGKIAEDAYIILDILNQCNSVVGTTAQKYYYIHRSNSITTKHYDDKYLDVIDAYEKNAIIINNLYPELNEIAKMRLCWAHFYVLDRIIMDADNIVTKKKLIQYIKDNILFIINDPHFSKERKLSAIALLINEKLYRECVILQNRRFSIN